MVGVVVAVPGGTKPIGREAEMRVVVLNHVTPDGVIQAPARSDEDTRGGFEHGGWAAAGGDETCWARVSACSTQSTR